MKLINYNQLCATLVLMALSALASAEGWTMVSDQSRLNFISVKKTNVAEVHEFKSVRGHWDATGHLNIDIDLASVDTQIEIRNQRMKELLFNVTQFSKATLTASIDKSVIDDLAISESLSQLVTAQLNLHGQTKPVELSVRVIRLAPDKIVVISDKPVIVNAGDYDLVAGVEKLREVAKLSSISYAVPVSFYLTFTASN